ncbi:MAG TPA: STAS domain-containing protein [Terracidiphilus sp.]|jgi:anti-sigma B factor antagonist
MDVRESGHICTIRLKGRLVREAVDQFEAAVRSAQANGCSFLILDLEASSSIDSCGIGAIVKALKTSTKMGGSVQLVKLSAYAEKMFKMCGILGLFGVYESEAEAISACGG